MPNTKDQVIRELYYGKSLSIATLSKLLNKSIPNVTKVINEMMIERLIVEDGFAPSTGGRRALNYCIREKALKNMLLIAVDQYYTQACLYDFENRPISKHILVRNFLDQQTKAYQTIVETIQTLLVEHPEEAQQVAAIGITMPGFVDSKAGTNNTYPTSSPLYAIKENIEKLFEIPTFIDNDSSAIAIAEYKLGSIKQTDNALVVNLNWGVGLGIIINSKLYKGHSGYAGEFSHIPLSNMNKLCSCGKKGCLEVEASLMRAKEYAENKIKQGEQSSLKEKYIQQKFITGEDLIQASNDGDQLAIEAMGKIGFMLGKGIATLIHILNPSNIIISGRGSRAGSILLPQIQSAILEYSISRIAKETTISISHLPEVQLLATACVAIENAKFIKTKIQ